MQVTNLAYFYETAKKVRGGKFVWVKDSNGEQRNNVLLGGTIINPKKGFDHLFAGQLVEYVPNVGCAIFRSYEVAIGGSSTTVAIKADGYSDFPEVGQLLMKAPSAADGTGQSGKVVSVEYNQETSTVTVVLDTSLGTLAPNDILVEAGGTAASQTAHVLCQNPNTFIEADRDLLPIEGYGLQQGTANYSISTVYNKQAWIARMQPLPSYVLEKNRSYIEGIFWI